jgi:hypothetical protein
MDTVEKIRTICSVIAITALLIALYSIFDSKREVRKIEANCTPTKLVGVDGLNHTIEIYDCSKAGVRQ